MCITPTGNSHIKTSVQVQEALRAIAPELLKILCSCQRPGASCHCQELGPRGWDAPRAAAKHFMAGTSWNIAGSVCFRFWGCRFLFWHHDN